ncbi:DUF4118 domain-containing protein [Pelomonas sp. BJYL3]|uniref:DUF4118 domain-containing protein n=1 Tax=Pelomonas sp. BJYL3 TaxID=2976697 RepID=UPI0022B54A5C|nr:DUF4118 domain-containing protein [Pelomonas sp. BJYL3]
MSEQRPDPDALLAQIDQQDREARRGRLRVYFGSSAGVGKTYAMLAAARKLQADGVDVLAGIVVTHGRAETQALLEGLPQLPLKAIEYRGKALPEFDLDAALARKPALVLVDELAHSNVPGSRHPKRWQDVEELLANGINVYSTLNVQHLESLNDIVGGITGVRVQETLPDTFFDAAHEVVMVDTPADELLSRLAAGKVYMGAQAERAAQHFFRKGNLMALRELALRRTADRVEDDVQAWRSNQRVSEVWKTEAALLCAIGPDPSDDGVVRETARLAQQLNVSWHAVYVETPQLSRLPDAQRERILRTVRLAHELGAETSVLSGQSIAQALQDHARQHNLSTLVLGRAQPLQTWQRWLGRQTLARALEAMSPDLDVLTVARRTPARAEQPVASAAQTEPALQRLRRYGLTAAACIGAAVLCWPLQWAFAQTNIVMVFLLAVLWVGWKQGRGPAVLASFLSVGLFDFFFVEPKLSFAVSDVQYLLTFAVMLAVGLLTGQLTAGLRYQALVASERERRARLLFELTSDLAGALQTDQVLEVAERTLAREVQGQVLIYTLDLHEQLQPSPREALLSDADRPDAGTARWALDHRQAAGLSTDTLPGSPWHYLPLEAPMRLRGVMALRPRALGTVLQPELGAQLATCGRIIGQALERVHYVEVAQQALVQIESERLRNSLLSALSHDLRTPLAVLYGLSQTLETLPGLPAQARELSLTLQQQSRRVGAMVNNLLDMARLESGSLQLNRQWQPLEEVIGTSLQILGDSLAQHRLQMRLPPGLPLLNLDAALMERVLCNLLENAVKYTPPGSQITLAAVTEPDRVVLSVEDDGPGLPAGREEQLFNKFSRGEKESSTPGVGLGLAICRAIVETHGGRIWAERSALGGAAFKIALPRGTPPSLEAMEADLPENHE